MKLTTICLWFAALALTACSAAPPVETSPEPEPEPEEEEQEATVAHRISSPRSGEGPHSEWSPEAERRELTPEEMEQRMAQILDGGISEAMNAVLGGCGNPDGGCDPDTPFSGIGGIGDAPEEEKED